MVSPNASTPLGSAEQQGTSPGSLDTSSSRGLARYNRKTSLCVFDVESDRSNRMRQSLADLVGRAQATLGKRISR